MLVCLLLFCLLLLKAPLAKSTAAEALAFCGVSLAPSLFPAAVLGRFLTLSGVFAGENRLVKKIAGLFGLSPAALPALAAGLVCGFPMGAFCAYALAEDGVLSPREAAHVAAFANNAGLAFLLGSVGPMFGGVRRGVTLFAAQTLASLVIGILTAKRARPKKGVKAQNTAPPPPAFQESRSSLALLSDCVGQSAQAMLTVTGFVVFFSVTSALFFSLPGLAPARLPLSLFLEPTAACRLVAASSLLPRTALSLAGFALGFSGLSVLMQSVALSRSLLPFWPTLAVRLAIAALTACLVFVLG